MDDLLALSTSSINSQNKSKNDNNRDDSLLYKKNLNENFDVMREYLKINNCSILKYGIKKSIEPIKYGYCATCDLNLIHPICMTCIENCHNEHSIKIMPEMDHIICGCGERLHKFPVKVKKNKLKNTIDCPFNEWCSVFGLTNRIKVKNIDICEFCYKLCGYEKDCIETETKLENCQCLQSNGKETHLEIKNIYNNLEMLLNKNNILILDKIDPMKFINGIFVAESSYYNLFSDFDETIKEWNNLENDNKIVIHENFMGTNFYLTLKIFCQILGKIKGKPLRYFVNQIINLIDFRLIKKIISCLEYKENIMVLNFLEKILFLYKKVVLGHETTKFEKLKIYDLENLSPFQRYFIFHTNKIFFSNAKSQLNFFIETYCDYISNEINIIENYDILIQITGILKRYSEFYLINVNQMTEICFSLEKTFEFCKKYKNHSKNVKYYLIIIKMFHYFVYYYNDELIYKKVKKVVKKIEDGENSCFIFHNNELGRLISRISMRLIFYAASLDKESLNILNENEKISVQKIIKLGIKLFQFLGGPIDSYLIISEKILNDSALYFDNIENNVFDDQAFLNIYYQTEKLETNYSQFYNYKLKENELIKEVSNSLDIIIEMCKKNDIKMLLIKSKYYFTLIKFLYIINVKNDDEIFNNFIKKFLLFIAYFIQNNSDNALLLFSHFIMKALLSLPEKYIIEILMLYKNAANLISMNCECFIFPKHSLKLLCKYLLDYNDLKTKEESEFKLIIKKDNKIWVEKLDNMLGIFLEILIKLTIQTKQFNTFLTKNFIKDMLFLIFNNLIEKNISKNNFFFLLFIINKIYDPTSDTDRKNLFMNFKIEKIEEDLEDLNIDLNYRIEILRFFKKFKYSIYYRQQMLSRQHRMNSMLISKKLATFKKTKMFKKTTFIQTNFGEKIIYRLFTSLKAEESKNNNYCNAFGQNADNFLLKNNQLIHNYKFPSKKLSFLYFLVKQFESTENEELENMSNGIKLIDNEFKYFKEIYEKNQNNMPSFIRYCIDGLFLPICSMINTLFCFTNECVGKEILSIYQIILKLIYIKIFLLNISDLLNGIDHTSYVSFDIKGFLDVEKLNETLEDYFNLENQINISPFDFTNLYFLFEKHFLNYIKYFNSLNLSDNFNVYYQAEEISKEYNFCQYFRGINIKKNSIRFIKKNKENDKIIIENDKNNNSEKENVIINTYVPIIKDVYESYKDIKLNIDNTNICFISSLNEICGENEINFRRMLLFILFDLVIDYELEEQCLFFIYYILCVQTSETQNDIIKNLGGKETTEKGIIVTIINKFYKCIMKQIINDFNFEIVHYNYNQKIIFSLVKILKYFCEEHNNFFQEKLISTIQLGYSKWSICQMELNKKDDDFKENYEYNESMSFFNFLINVMQKILMITQKCKNEQYTNSLYDIIYCILELLIEIIQGNNKEILDPTNSDKNQETLFFFNNFSSIMTDIIFDDNLKNKTGFKVRMLLMNFVNSILEEEKNEEIKKLIIKYLTINKVIKSMLYTLKNYFYIHTFDDIKYKEYYNNYTENQILQKQFKFDNTLYDYFIEIYFKDEKFSKESSSFNLSNNYYKYFKLLSLSDLALEAQEMISQFNDINITYAKKKFNLSNNNKKNSIEVVPINLINEKQHVLNYELIEKYYLIKFFESITKIVEIRLPKKNYNTQVIFTIPCEMIYLSNSAKEDFITFADRTNETTKKNDLITHIPLFQLEIQISKSKNLNSLQNVLINLNYVVIQTILYIIGVGINIFILCTLQGYKEIEIEDSSSRRLRFLSLIKEKYRFAIDKSLNKWDNYYDICMIIFAIVNLFFVLLWCFLNMPVYYKIDILKYCQENKKDKNQLTLLNKIYIFSFFTIFKRNYINTFIYMFVISMIGVWIKQGIAIFSLNLLAIININETLKGIVVAIYMEKGDVGSTLFLLIILVYLYTNLGFFLIQKDFTAEIEIEGYEDNYCESLVFCFLTNIDAGIRARGGAADQMIRVSFERNNAHYISRIFYDVTYFLICIIIMIDLVFGILLGTFSKLREEERMKENDRINHCFICHKSRAVVEKNKEDFDVHRNVTHYIWNYVEYMIFLNLSDFHDLNASNSFARECLNNNSYIFLPTSKEDIKEIEENKTIKISDDNSEEISSEEEEEEEENDENVINEENNENDNDNDNILEQDEENFENNELLSNNLRDKLINNEQESNNEFIFNSNNNNLLNNSNNEN